MKKISICLCSLAMVLWLVGASGATPVELDVSGTSSSVFLSTLTSLDSTLTASLVSTLGANEFVLQDNQTQEIDFFTLTATSGSPGSVGGGVANIYATLAFASPQISASGTGRTGWGTWEGVISGGVLSWNDASLPDAFTLADGNRISIDFEEGLRIGLGDQVTVHAYITNLGGGSAPVPEPGTIALLGSGLFGLGLYGRRRMKSQN